LATGGHLSRGTDRRLRLIGLAAVVCVGLGLWLAIGRYRGPESTGEAAPETPTTVPPAVPATPTLLSGGLVAPEGGELLDRPTGLHLLVGHDEGVIDIDLDRGTQNRLPVAGYPVLVSDRWLVVVDLDSHNARAYHLDGGAVTDLPGDGYHPWTNQVAIEGPPGSAWLLSWGPSGALDWRLVDLATGEVLDSSPADAGFWPQVPGPDLATSRAGGVFARSDDGEYERVQEGTPVAAGNGRALIRSCPSPTRCALSWHDASTWSPLSLLVPPVPADEISAAELSASGSLLAMITSEPGVHLLDVDRGTFITMGDVGSPISLAPSGRYAAMGGPDGVVVMSMPDQSWTSIELNEPPDRGFVLVEHGTGA
jgi:hypothetical protein